MSTPEALLKFKRRTLGLVAAVAASSLTLAACGNNADDPAESTPAAETTVAEENTAEETTSAESSSTTATTATTSTSSTSSGTGSSSSTSSAAMSADEETLAEVRETFAGLAPEELFDQFDGCSAAGISGSFDCQGDEIGQFQFFDSDAKAASSTQLLTELRSSRVVEDSGDRVVGWSTLGTSAIITVVDNRAGQVMQQLISSDQEDPRQRIYDLGLAKEP
ncbi:hypothetical protein [Corynebacterium lujinxingii]|uniref:Beta-N-acetylglucosaminidase n=1 Tax=Corynebacterium lujinxingii TaxID=2763010 RepID=A0A7H0K067_9CORY|nr:hypothetical protein [Corynebacterium lujinxingii]MBC3179131.1 hypothetical protein [Corynebacterium lujinxingii]NNO11259.1 hypothetical protein [Corynebacterium lujinxingii]QNP90683.1 hypothetical protein IAU68_02570 [Corynebacterium lujinxingii]